MKKRSIFAFLTLGLFVAYRRFKRELDEGTNIGQPEDLKKIGLSREVFLSLPRLSHMANGRSMEWMNLILLGNRQAIEAALVESGWYRAEEVTPRSLFKAFVTILRKGQYLTGPMTPLFVGDRPQAFGYQKPTELNTFLQRHHARFWPTGHTDEKGRAVWIAHASYDKWIKGQGRFNFPPTHEIDGELDTEREVIVHDLIATGSKLLGYVQLQPPGDGINGFDDEFHSDGRAAVVEVKK